MPHQLQLRFVCDAEPIDLFVSYCHEDKQTVDDLLVALPNGDQTTVDTFRDVNSIRSGQLWEKSLVSAVLRAEVFMPILSEEYVDSSMCLFELMLFTNRGVVRSAMFDSLCEGITAHDSDSTVLPYRIGEKVRIPPTIQRLHATAIPTERPFPCEFLNDMRGHIVSTVIEKRDAQQQAYARLFPPDVVTRHMERCRERSIDEYLQPVDEEMLSRFAAPNRSRVPFQGVAKAVSFRCAELLDDASLPTGTRSALETVMSQTEEYLASNVEEH